MVELATTRAFYPSRPSISIEGTAQPGLELGIISLMVFENTHGLYRCEATLGNWGAVDGSADFLYFDRQLLDFGKNITIRMGDSEAAAEIFNGKIMAIEGRFPQQGPPEILLLAEDRLQDLRMLRRSRSFEQQTIADVISAIASEHGLTADIDLSGPTYKQLAQVNQSDLAFIRECAHKVDAEIWVEGDTLHAQARARRMHEEINLQYGQRLREFSVIADLACQRSSLVVSGWDTDAKDTVQVRVDSSAIESELDGKISGARVLEDSFGERVERIVHQVPFNNDEARYMAEAKFKNMARRFISGQGMAEGDGRLRVGSYVSLSGLGVMFNGQYFITEVTHRFDPVNGYQTHFCVQRPGLGS